jgi:hypothetical protein
MAQVSPSDAPYWTFAQALAWVIYRRGDLVDYVGPTGDGRLSLIAMYPSQFTPPVEKIGEGEELLQALRQGRLEATGKPAQGDGIRLAIPLEDWLRLRRYGAKIFQMTHANSSAIQPWHDITLRSDAVKKLWRSRHEIYDRSRFDWDAIKHLYQQVRASNPDFSQNELITETQGRYEDEFNKEPPSRTSFQRKIGTWS